MMMKSLIILLLCLLSGSRCDAQSGLIDGTISFDDLTDTVRFKPWHSSREVLIKQNKDYIYIGIRNAEVGQTSIVLKNEKEIIVVHLSGCTGRATYEAVAKDSFKITRSILPVRTHPGQWDRISNVVMSKVLKKTLTIGESEALQDKIMADYGYRGTTFDEGSCFEYEALISKKKYSGYKMLVEYLGWDSTENKGVSQYFPPIESVCSGKISKLTEGASGTSMRIDCSERNWLLIQ